MNDKLIFSLIMLTGVFLSSVSQVILKKSANKIYDSKWKEYLNIPVLTAYFIFFSCTFLTMLSLRVIPISLSTILESCGYIFVTILGVIFLNEKISFRKMIGMIFIILGIIFYVI